MSVQSRPDTWQLFSKMGDFEQMWQNWTALFRYFLKQISSCIIILAVYLIIQLQISPKKILYKIQKVHFNVNRLFKVTLFHGTWFALKFCLWIKGIHKKLWVLTTFPPWQNNCKVLYKISKFISLMSSEFIATFINYLGLTSTFCTEIYGVKLCNCMLPSQTILRNNWKIGNFKNIGPFKSNLFSYQSNFKPTNNSIVLIQTNLNPIKFIIKDFHHLSSIKNDNFIFNFPFNKETFQTAFKEFFPRNPKEENTKNVFSTKQLWGTEE